MEILNGIAFNPQPMARKVPREDRLRAIDL
jgi:hypothetical protein